MCGEGHLTTEAEIGMMWLRAMGCPGCQLSSEATREAWDRLPLKALRRSQPCLYERLDFWPPACEREISKSPSLWCFVTAALGNSYSVFPLFLATVSGPAALASPGCSLKCRFPDLLNQKLHFKNKPTDCYVKHCLIQKEVSGMITPH